MQRIFRGRSHRLPNCYDLSTLASHDSLQFFARLVVVFICAIFILVRPLARFGHSYPFLILTFKELIFFIQDG